MSDSKLLFKEMSDELWIAVEESLSMSNKVTLAEYWSIKTVKWFVENVEKYTPMYLIGKVKDEATKLLKHADVALKNWRKETKEFWYKHGQKVYKDWNKYYSKDVDSHNWWFWKVFEKQWNKLIRIWTADVNWKIFKN